MSDELADLYFGRDDAELDIAEGGLLRAGFLPTPAYNAARKARKHLIIGRKGSGKSAICRTLAAEDDPRLATLLVTPDALSADEIRRFELQGVEPGMAKRMLWRYVLATQVAKHVVTHAEAAHKKVPAPVAKLRTFLVDNGELDVSRPRLYEAIKKLRSLKLQAFGVGLEVGSPSNPSEGTRTDHQLEVVERHIELAIEELACPEDHPRLLLLVDQVEDVWSEDGEADSLVVGLLKASRAVGVRFARVSCVVFLRSDIYDLLRFADKDKYHGDEMRVDWTAERLRELVLARARASVGVGAERLWGEIFPTEVAGVPTWDYLVAHTLMRPRDVIHLCNLCRDTAENNGHATVTEADVAEAVRQYSEWKLADLPNEYIANYPFLDALLAAFKDHGYVVTRAAVDRRVDAVREVLAVRFPERAEAMTTQNMLDVLYDTGFLGVRRNHHVLYAVRDGDRVELSDTEFHIHPAFRPALRARRASSTEVFDPRWLRGLIRDAIASQSPGGGLRRGSVEYQLLRRSRRGVRRLLGDVEHARLPVEVHREVSANLRRMLGHLDDLMSNPPPAHLIVEAVEHIRAFLDGLAERLAMDGFGERDVFFVASIHRVARSLRYDVRGETYTHDGGSGSDG